MGKILEFKSRASLNRLGIESALREVIKKHTGKADVIDQIVCSSLDFIDRGITMIEFEALEIQGLDEEAECGVQSLVEKRNTLAEDASLLIQELIVRLANSEAERLS